MLGFIGGLIGGPVLVKVEHTAEDVGSAINTGAQDIIQSEVEKIQQTERERAAEGGRLCGMEGHRQLKGSLTPNTRNR